MPSFLVKALLLTAGLASAFPTFPTSDCDDTDRRICYGDPDGESQNVDVADLLAAASDIRKRFDGGDQLLHRLSGFPNCGDWTVLQTGTVLVLTKHLTARYNSTVAYDDIAYTIDGGANGDLSLVSDDIKAKTLLGCGEHGGQMAVVVNASNPLYQTDSFKASKDTTKYVIVKVVKAPVDDSTTTTSTLAAEPTNALL